MVHGYTSIICQWNFSEGEVNEKFYDDHNFPLDNDHKGQVWRLNSNTYHLTRSKVMYHSTVISKKERRYEIVLSNSN